jgi:4-hydroxymandelate synthase
VAVRAIEYVELYTSNRQSAVDYLVSSLGFTQMAESANDDKSSALLRQGEVQLLVTSGPGTRRFLEVHGDGIADIALTCDDVSITLNAATAAGAMVIDDDQKKPVISGFGVACHTLLSASEGAGSRLPPGREWMILSPSVRRHSQIQLLDHVAICLEAGDLSNCADFFADAFGFARYSAEYLEVGNQAMDSLVVRNPSGRITLTLLAPDSTKRAGQLDAFLDRNGGPGVQHLAFGVDDIVPAVHDLKSRGVKFLRTPGAYYDRLPERFPEMSEEMPDLRASHVLADRDEWGFLLQIFTRSPYERNTLFYELIQRRGARGFGSANIRALYEAVERDRLAVE